MSDDRRVNLSGTDLGPMDQVRAVAEELESTWRRADAMSDDSWQPIESAPKDGTRILACDGDVIEVIYWVNGWFNQSCEISTWRAFPPTHWMPLPEPPSEG